MKRLLMLSAIILILAAQLLGCSNTDLNPSIGEPVVAKSIDERTSRPIEATTRFGQSDPAIYFTIKTMDLPKDTKLKVIWKYLDDNTQISSEITSQGTGYESFALKRSSSHFPAGKYEVSVTGNTAGRDLKAKGTFSVIQEAPPSHLLNPQTSKSVDNQDDLNPVNITAEFSQADPVIYFIFQSKDLPQNTKVSCIWYYLDNGDTLTHELITAGNRNIAFSLKPDEGKRLPAGKYIATATIVINNETESVSKEFEIKAPDSAIVP